MDTSKRVYVDALTIYQDQVMQKLYWKNLLENKCPKCSDELSHWPQSDTMVCSIRCAFSMKRTSYERIIAKLNKEEYEAEETIFEGDSIVFGDGSLMEYEEEE